MWRTHRNPYTLQEQLENAREKLAEAKLNEKSDDYIIDLQMEIYELEEQINFAWQDDEFYEDCLREEYPDGDIPEYMLANRYN